MPKQKSLACILALPHWEMACQIKRDEAKWQVSTLTKTRTQDLLLSAQLLSKADN